MCIKHYMRWRRHGDPKHERIRPATGLRAEIVRWLDQHADEIWYVWEVAEALGRPYMTVQGALNVLALKQARIQRQSRGIYTALRYHSDDNDTIET